MVTTRTSLWPPNASTHNQKCHQLHTSILAAVIEVEGWSNHRIKQHVYVAFSPLCYCFLGVVLMGDTSKFEVYSTYLLKLKAKRLMSANLKNMLAFKDD